MTVRPLRSAIDLTSACANSSCKLLSPPIDNYRTNSSLSQRNGVIHAGMGDLESALGEPLSLSGRVRRELQFDLEPITREYALGLRDEDCQVLDAGEHIHPQLGRLLGHRGECASRTRHCRHRESSYRHPPPPRSRRLKSVRTVPASAGLGTMGGRPMSVTDVRAGRVPGPSSSEGGPLRRPLLDLLRQSCPEHNRPTQCRRQGAHRVAVQRLLGLQRSGQRMGQHRLSRVGMAAVPVWVRPTDLRELPVCDKSHVSGSAPS